MNIDDILDDLETCEGQVPATVDQDSAEDPDSAEASRLRSLEVAVLSDRERRERCLQPICLEENKRVTHKLKEIERTHAIRSFLETKSNSKERNSSKVKSETQHQRVYKFISETAGIPFSITSAVSGDRVYCSSHCKPAMVKETVSKDKSILERISVEDIQRRMQESRLQSPRYTSSSVKPEGVCWVHKYAPKSFSELISDDRTNRELVKWLKNWKPLRSNEQTLASQSKTPDTKKQSMKTPSKSEFCKITDFFSTPKEQKTPGGSSAMKTVEERVVILCGPLGVGKTCLAKAACKICGYLPFIIDSSDDRSPTALELVLSSVCGMNSLSGTNQRRCIVFDEVDTLPPGNESREAIKFIVNFIRGSSRGSTLKKPMIFICSEVHAPYLTPLRKLAKTLYFPQPKINKALVTRLQKICTFEQVTIDLPELHQLVEESRNDISCCLNALQFQSRCNNASSTGMKTIKVSPFRIWESILLPSPITSEPFEKVSGLYESFGEFALILNGILANYTQLKLHDGFLTKSKMIASLISKTNHLLWSLPHLCPVMFLAIRRLAQSPEREVKIEWPRKEFENIRQTTTNNYTLQGFLQDLPAKSRSCVDLSSLAVEFLPYVSLMLPNPLQSPSVPFFSRLEGILKMMGGSPVFSRESTPRMKRIEGEALSPPNKQPRHHD